MTAMAPAAVVPAGWLRGRDFDLAFVAGVSVLALACGVVVVQDPRLFAPLLLLDLWLLGYPHVIATGTRLCFDRESLRRSRFLLFGLPPLVLLGVVALATGIGAWTLGTTYLYWQWFHYTRQSWGVQQVYRRRAGELLDEHETLARVAFYALPLWGILHRSHQAPELFLRTELRVLPVPGLLVDAVALLALLSLAWWIGSRAVAAWRGRLPVAHTLFVLSHFTVFGVGYLVIPDIDHGWLVLNVWHNAQYLLFVWLYNNKRFQGEVDPQARFLSTLSQDRNAWKFAVIVVGISTTLYLTIRGVVEAPAVAILVYQTINFHHYIVDGLIWKVRRPGLRRTLGLAS